MQRTSRSSLLRPSRSDHTRTRLNHRPIHDDERGVWSIDHIPNNRVRGEGDHSFVTPPVNRVSTVRTQNWCLKRSSEFLSVVAAPITEIAVQNLQYVAFFSGRCLRFGAGFARAERFRHGNSPEPPFGTVLLHGPALTDDE